MSLAIFSVKNQYYKNGTYFLTKVFGGGPKWSIELLVKLDMMHSVSNVESGPISSTILDNKCCTGALYKPLTLQICLVFTQKWIPVMDMDTIVSIIIYFRHLRNV